MQCHYLNKMSNKLLYAISFTATIIASLVSLILVANSIFINYDSADAIFTINVNVFWVSFACLFGLVTMNYILFSMHYYINKESAVIK